MGNWGIIGHEREIKGIEAFLSGTWHPHAFLLVGPPQVGKGTLARRLAQALNCLAPPPQRPCQLCPQCQRIASSLHPDVYLVTVEPGGKEVRISQIRELEHWLYLKPYEGRMRVAIIDPADAMNIEAQNAFLKTLEEPPEQAVLILVACHEGRLLPTVRSRCQRVALAPVPIPLLASALAQMGVREGELFARLAQGRPGLALTLAYEPDLWARWQEEAQRAASLPHMSIRDRLQLAQALASAEAGQGSPKGLLWALDVWERWWEDVLLVQGGALHLAAHLHLLPQLEASAQIPSQEVQAFLWAIMRTRQYLESNVNARLALEILLLEAPQVPSDNSKGALAVEAGAC